jgi:5-methylcytosine-specific restriction endonuclease McrA
MSRLWIPKKPRLRHRPTELLRRTRQTVVGRDYQRIEHDTRTFVWARDRGRCRNCGSDRNLQFDHIIPKSLGGSNVAENVELLCQSCNVRKNATVFAPRADAQRRADLEAVANYDSQD